MTHSTPTPQIKVITLSDTTEATHRPIVAHCWTCAHIENGERVPEPLTAARAEYHLEHGHDVRIDIPLAPKTLA